jgi:hypothetical protein
MTYRWGATPLLTGYNGSCEALLRCSECGALVARYDRERHDAWHDGPLPVPKGWAVRDPDVTATQVISASPAGKISQ